MFVQHGVGSRSLVGGRAGLANVVCLRRLAETTEGTYDNGPIVATNRDVARSAARSLLDEDDNRLTAFEVGASDDGHGYRTPYLAGLTRRRNLGQIGSTCPSSYATRPWVIEAHVRRVPRRSAGRFTRRRASVPISRRHSKRQIRTTPITISAQR